MNDGKVSKFAIASILMASILTNGIKFSGETKPTFNEVSSKFNFTRKQQSIELLIILDGLHGSLR